MALLTATDLNVAYAPARGEEIRAVRDVELSLEEGEFVGVVGESGCGKSTLGYALTRTLQPPAHLTGGAIDFDGTDIADLDGEELRHERSHGFALVLQSGMNALNPVRTVAHHLGDILRAHRRPGEHVSDADVRRVGADVLAKVRLEASVLDRYPHELSGGMRQRVAIALALALDPRFLVFDEPTTALDVVVQRAVMETIRALQHESGFTALLISHDLGVVLEVTDRVLVMYAGRIVQDRPAASMLEPGNHPYTDALLSCYADPRAEVVELGGIPGSPPDLSKDIAGCAFAPRCHLAEPVCREVLPALTRVGDGRVACHVRAREAAPVGASHG